MAAPPDQAQVWQTAFGHRVRALREGGGLSQMRLAEQAGLHVTYLSGVERGRRNVSLVNIHMLARALQVEPGQLLNDQD